MGVIVSNGLHQLSLISLKPTTTNKQDFIVSPICRPLEVWSVGYSSAGRGVGGTSDLLIPSRASSLCCLWIFRTEIPQNKIRGN